MRMHFVVFHWVGWIACRRRELYRLQRCVGIAVWMAATIGHRMLSIPGAEFIEVKARAV